MNLKLCQRVARSLPGRLGSQCEDHQTPKPPYPGSAISSAASENSKLPPRRKPLLGGTVVSLTVIFSPLSISGYKMPLGAVNLATAHVPAWKRLGLTLKQPGNAVTLPQELQKVEKKRIKNDSSKGLKGSISANIPELVASAKGNHSGLGKRKFESRVAEDDDKVDDAEHKKKKKASKDQTSSYDSIQSLQFAVPAEAAHAAVSCATPSASNDSPCPKGDPNYRIKKGKSKEKPGNQSSSAKHDDISTTTERVNADGRPQLAKGQKVSKPELKPSEIKASYTYTGNGQDNSENDLRASTEPTSLQLDLTNDHTSTKVSKKAKQSKRRLGLEPSSVETTATPSLVRRKSVTFTPDTKTSDGNSAQELFKTWVAQQKGPSAEFTADEVAQFVPPPNLHPANDLPSPEPISKSSKKDLKKVKKVEKAKKADEAETAKSKSKVNSKASQSDEGVDSAEEQAKPSKVELKTAKKSQRVTGASSNGKRDPSPYLLYLDRYHKSRESWKFNKATQTDVLKNALNVFRIPSEYSTALREYNTGLQGAAARDRLSEAAKTTLKELDDSEPAEEKGEDENTLMDGLADRQAAHDSALRTRLKKEKKRRRDEADEKLRALKRRRAEEILQALAARSSATPRASFIITQPSNGAMKNQRIVFQDEDASAPQPRARKRKRRADFSDDESSSNSSSSSSDDESIPSPANSDDDSDADSDSGSDDDSEEEEEHDSSSDSSSEASSSSDGENSSSSEEESDSESSDSDSN